MFETGPNEETPGAAVAYNWTNHITKHCTPVRHALQTILRLRYQFWPTANKCVEQGRAGMPRTSHNTYSNLPNRVETMCCQKTQCLRVKRLRWTTYILDRNGYGCTIESSPKGHKVKLSQGHAVALISAHIPHISKDHSFFKRLDGAQSCPLARSTVYERSPSAT